eukprot:2224502-Amphidinium_carterae.1
MLTLATCQLLVLALPSTAWYPQKRTQQRGHPRREDGPYCKIKEYNMKSHLERVCISYSLGKLAAKTAQG